MSANVDEAVETNVGEKSSPEAGGSDIESLRNILFGNHARTTDNRLSALESAVPALKSQLLEKVDAEISTLRKAGQKQQRDSKKAQSETTKSISALEQSLKSEIVEMQETLLSELQALREESNRRWQKAEEGIAAQLEQMNVEMRRQDDALRQELLTATSFLDDRKATRADLGRMFIELGDQLQAQTQVNSANGEA